MRRGFGGAFIATLVAASFVIHADTTPPSQAVGIQLQLGRLLFAEGRYPEALDAFQKALAAKDPASLRLARVGTIQSALRTAEFVIARTEADKLLRTAPRDPEALSLSADSLWASGLFDE